MSLKDEYFAMMIARFKRWDAELGMLSEDGGQTSDAGKAHLEEQKALRASRDAAYTKLQEIRTASESGWRSLQAAVDAAWIPMRSALDQAASRSKMREKAAR